MHRIDYLDFDSNTPKLRILDECIEIARRNGDSGSLYSPIAYFDDILETREEALKFIEEKDSWYSNLAVRYKYLDSKKGIELEKKLNELLKKKEEYKKAHSISSFKAEFVGCSSCGSKLSKHHLKGNTCPLCGNDLRSQTTMDTLKRYEERIKTLKEQLKLENAKHGKINWLVKIEFHC